MGLFCRPLGLMFVTLTLTLMFVICIYPARNKLAVFYCTCEVFRKDYVIFRKRFISYPHTIIIMLKGI